MYWYMPGLCRECQFIWWLHSPWNSQLRTAERRVFFWGEISLTLIKTCIWVGMFPFVKIYWKRNCFWQTYDLCFFFFGRPTRTFLLRVVKTIFSTHARMHTHTHTHTQQQQQLLAQQTSVWHLFFVIFMTRDGERERESGRVIETNAQTHRMWCVRGLG